MSVRSSILNSVVLCMAAVLLAAGCSGGRTCGGDSPVGWALCENIDGGYYALSGGSRCPEKGVRGCRTVLRSCGGDMKEAIEEAIRNYDIIILDGSNGPFLYSETSFFDSLRNKTIVGINGAVLQSRFQLTGELKDSLDRAQERYPAVLPEPDGKYRLSNDSLVRSFPAYCSAETILEVTGDTSISFMRSGFWHFRNASGNIIIRNIAFDGPGAMRGMPHSMVSFRNGCDHVWVDHCLFEDFARLALAFTKQCDCFTVSWCEFRITAQSGGHSLGVMLSSGDDNWEDEDLLNITFDHCLWSGVWSRVPMARFGTVHILNNVYECPGTVGINPRTNSEFLVEGCWFSPGTKPYCSYRTDVAPCKACEFRDCAFDSSFEVLNKGSVSVPYVYAVEEPAAARDRVVPGAGPTLRKPLRISTPARNK